ncbi:hypothetical protein C8R42DRAFT_345786 [Lentinula raphanica]|nr:hypothetical protein C8R42DRAFT_345786 [Lentinula raphanica]
MFVRVSAFTLFGLITVIVGALFFLLAFIDPGSANKSLVALDIIYATIPVAGVCIFGSHKDLLHVCLFWRNRPNTSNENLITVMPSQRDTLRTVLQSHFFVDRYLDITITYATTRRHTRFFVNRIVHLSDANVFATLGNLVHQMLALNKDISEYLHLPLTWSLLLSTTQYCLVFLSSFYDCRYGGRALRFSWFLFELTGVCEDIKLLCNETQLHI